MSSPIFQKSDLNLLFHRENCLILCSLLICKHFSSSRITEERINIFPQNGKLSENGEDQDCYIMKVQ